MDVSQGIGSSGVGAGGSKDGGSGNGSGSSAGGGSDGESSNHENYPWPNDRDYFNGPGVHSMGSMYLEDGSFDDGYAGYARFFEPMGITVTREGNVIWVADYGNNKVRNISCELARAPTFEPTLEPTHRPSTHSTATPIVISAEGKGGYDKVIGGKSSKVAKNTKSPSTSKGGKSKVGKISVRNKSSKSGSKTASVDGIVSVYVTSASGMSASALISVFAASLLVAMLMTYLCYYRRRVYNAMLGHKHKDISQKLGQLSSRSPSSRASSRAAASNLTSAIDQDSTQDNVKENANVSVPDFDIDDFGVSFYDD